MNGFYIAEKKTNAMMGDIKNYRRRLLMECRIAGLAYHNEDHIVDELSVGTKLALVREKNNEHDKNAVAIASACDYEGNPDDFDFRFILGYIPKEQNEGIAAMLDMGYADSLEAEIIKINGGKSLYDKVVVGIFIKNKDDVPVGQQLWAVRLSSKKLLDIQQILWSTGNDYQEWGGDAFYEGNLPGDEDKIVYICQHQAETVLYLLMNRFPRYINVDAEGPVEEGHKRYYLHNVMGPIFVSNDELDFLNKEQISDEPAYPLSSSASEKLLSIFRSYMEPETPDLDVSDMHMPTGNESKKWYVRCVESDGSDYLYRTCNSKEEAQAVVDAQDSNTDLYEHLYIVDKEIDDIKGNTD